MAAQALPLGAGAATRLSARRRWPATAWIAVVSLTGGLAAGRAVAAAVPRMAALQLELVRGVEPGDLVRPLMLDVALERPGGSAWRRVRRSSTGSWCEAPRRVFVAAARHDDLLDGARAHRGPAGPFERDGARRAGRTATLRARPGPGSGRRRASPRPTCRDVRRVPLADDRRVRGRPGARGTSSPSTLHAVGSDEAALAAANATGDGLAATRSATTLRASSLGASCRPARSASRGRTADLAAGSAHASAGTAPVRVLRPTGTRVDDPGLPI